jgi:AtzE family amidohydrolase
MEAAGIAAAVRAGRLSAVAVAEQALAAIAARDGAVNAFTDVTAARARAEAEAVDRAVAAGRDPGPLAGVPYAAKNLFDLEGLPTRAGSAIRRGAAPAGRDAMAVRRLAAAGAVCIGATNMDEFAYGFTTENSHDGPTRNPHDPARVAGGSSGGSAASVAAGLVPLAIGTDTNGSVRVPAALTGIFGLKPTYGRLSRQGAFPFVGSLDHVGPLARDLADLALAYDAMQGADPDDPVQVRRTAEPVSALLDGATGGLRIALGAGHFGRGGLDCCHAAAAAAARALGATAEARLDLAGPARAAAFLITMAEGGSLHLPDLRDRAAEYDPLTRDRFLAGALLPASWLIEAQRLRAAFRAEALALFETVDVLITPATPYPAPLIGQATIELAGETVSARAMLGLFSQPVSCIGLPALVVPLADPAGFGVPNGLPIGLQLVAAPWREDHLFRVAAALVAAGLVAPPQPPR